MFERLQGKTVLITGASSGIGEACAYQFAAAGANVILGARRIDRLSTVSATIRAKHPSVTVETIELDVRNSKAVDQAVSSISGDIDVLVNNAGLAMGTDTVDNLSDAAIDAVIDTNVKGLLYVSRAVVRRMKQQGGGHVIMMGSIAGIVGYQTGSVYCATKAAVKAITESLRAETIGVPIRVTEIKPGMVETEFSVVRYGGDKEKASSVYHGIEPMTADDVAESVVFAASRHPRCVVADVVLLATGQASATLAHRKYFNMGFHPGHFSYAHRCHGRLRNKLIFAGVTLWLASTVIAGVRRSTGWTHNSHRLASPPPPPPVQINMPPNDERLQWLEQEYVAAAPDAATREQRQAWVSAERARVAWAWNRSTMARNHCNEAKGLMTWYLGVGERTLDWATRKISRSQHFHWQSPPTSTLPPTSSLQPPPAGESTNSTV
ncbi:hypothetical protein GGI19_000492 [Coemansia pectinata]|uniref:Uncharacterized protein n=1 Tax=Coemansia pectinata TaxID=1052879 RepID=A0A9W8GZC4_9FUNG|nr:hypothetical protein GGI19_000492 [Coemansia pectinata]